MSKYPYLLFFDGYKASPREVHVEIDNEKIYISNIDDQDGHVLALKVSDATISLTGNQLFIFLK